ncbi:hypothetical protein RI367_005469 [Sorochytrium milnesiophthora]
MPSTPYPKLIILFLTAWSITLASAPTSQFILRLVCEEFRKASGDVEAGGGGASQTLSFLNPAADVSEYCKRPDVQGAITTYTTKLSLFHSIPALFLVSLYGRMSDMPSIGRKPFLVMPLFGMMAQMTCVLIIGVWRLPSWVLGFGYLAEGLSGGFGTLLTAFFALSADKVEPHRRTYFYTLIEVAMFLGFALGPLTMSWIVSLPVSEQFPELIFCIGLVGMLISITSVFVIVKTGKPKPAAVAAAAPDLSQDTEPLLSPAASEQSAPASVWSIIRDKANIATGLPILWRPWNRTRFVLICIMLVCGMCFSGISLIFIPYTYRHFNWTSKEDGLYFFIQSLSKLVALGLSAPIMGWLHRSAKPAALSPTAATAAPSDSPAPAQQKGVVGTQDETHARWPSGASTLHEVEVTEHTRLLLPELDPAGEDCVVVPVLDPDAEPVSEVTKSGRWIDGALVRSGLILYALAFLGFGLAWEGWMFYAVTIFDSLGVLCFPSMRSILSQTVPSSSQGTLMSSISLVTGIGHIVAPVAFNTVYKHTVGHADGAVYFIAASGWFIAFLASFLIRKRDVCLPEESLPAAASATSDAGPSEAQ